MLSLKMAFSAGWLWRRAHTVSPWSASKALSPVRTLCSRWPHAAQTVGCPMVRASGRMLAGTSERRPSPIGVIANVPSGCSV